MSSVKEAVVSSVHWINQPNIHDFVYRSVQNCGPFEIAPYTGCPAAVVAPESSLDQIIETWAHILNSGKRHTG